MNRSDESLFDPRIADWLEEDPHAAPDQALDVVLAAFPSINQRHAARVPWRFGPMNGFLRLGLVAAAVIIAAVGGLYLLGGRSGPNVGASPTPTATAQTEASVPPSPSPVTTRSATTASFTSPVYGYTIEHPIAFQPTPATEIWVDGVVANAEPWVDRFFSPASFVGIASQALDADETPAAWMDAYLPGAAARLCAVPIDSWTDTTVNGAAGRRAEFDCQGSPGVDVIWVVDAQGWVISGERAVVDGMLPTLELP
jgi:hypothetical protein